MPSSAVTSMLLSSTDPERLRSWYVAGLRPAMDEKELHYLVLRFGQFYLMIDSRDDVGERNPEPGRVILNFEVDDARAAVARLDELDTTWLAELEDRDGNLMATAIDPDGNYVQLVQPSPEHKAKMA